MLLINMFTFRERMNLLNMTHTHEQHKENQTDHEEQQSRVEAALL